MKTVYRLGEDLFLAVSFMSFIVGAVLRLTGFANEVWGISIKEIIGFSVICLLFSIAHSLLDLNNKQ